MTACAEVTKELYVPASAGVTVWVNQRYLGAGCRREEERKDQRISGDFHQNVRRRQSEDNGRTWSDWQPVPDPPMQDGCTLITCVFATGYDPDAKVTLQAVFHRLSRGAKNEGVEAWWQHNTKAYADHMFVQWSADDGRTWAPMAQLRYQPGDSFSPANWAAKGFLASNEMYGGYAFARNRDGRMVYPVSVPNVIHHNEDGSSEQVLGVRCMLGRWDAPQRAYAWEASPEPITVPHRLSGRGLEEPAIAALTNGDLLLSLRAANVCDGPDPWRGIVESPGRAWHAVSRDGGYSWGHVSDLRYDTGEQFYVPSAMARFIRSTKTGKLYWLGNIPRARPNGDNYRYPLVLAEVVETMPALKRDSVVVIEDREPTRQAEIVGFSNFSVLENRATLDLELILPHFAERGILADGQLDFSCNTWRYVIRLH